MENGQPDLPDSFAVPTDLATATYQLLGQLNAQSAAEVYMQWTRLINEQVEAHRAEAEREAS